MPMVLHSHILAQNLIESGIVSAFQAHILSTHVIVISVIKQEI